MTGKLTNIFLILFITYVSFGLLLYVMQSSLLYFPTAAIKHSYDEITFSHKGVKIKATVLNRGMKKAIIYFGGNAELVIQNAAVFSTAFPDHTIYLVNYRGYGGSTGKPEENAIYSDAVYIFDQIKPEYTEISIIGRSLGSGVATLLASKRDINKLVLITPFDSIQNVAQQHYPIYPMSLMLKDKYDSLSRVKSISAETLIIYAENDEVINIRRTSRLIKEFPVSQVTVKMIKNAEHNSISNYEEYYLFLRNFL